jgi:hypothetical protein
MELAATATRLMAPAQDSDAQPGGTVKRQLPQPTAWQDQHAGPAP